MNHLSSGISTQGIKYAGSKLKLLKYILFLAEKVGVKSVLDGFSGTTRVAQAFSQNGYRVISNDISVWSSVFGKCYLLNKKDINFYRELIEHLNHVTPFDGWFTDNYGGRVYNDSNSNAIQVDGSKKPWQLKNTRKLDAIRKEIDALNLDDVTKSIALTSLILALDKVDSTLGHFSAYLRNWSPRSFNELKLEIPKVSRNYIDNKVCRSDIFDCLKYSDCELSYFDPPYGSNNEKMPPSRIRYAAYYHIWTTVINNDHPETFGRALRRVDTSDKISRSVFEEYRRTPGGRYIALEAIENLIRRTCSPWIILSYSSGGRATAEELNQVINDNAELECVLEIDYQKNVMSSMVSSCDWLRQDEVAMKEYLFLIKK